jgi:hypothetical protein
MRLPNPKDAHGCGFHHTINSPAWPKEYVYPMRPRIIVLVLAVAVVSAGIALWVDSRSGEGADAPDAFQTNGPVRKQNSTAYSIAIDAGQRFTDGFSVLQVTGNSPVKILSIQSVQAGPSLQFLGALIAGQKRLYASDESLSRYPPPSQNLGQLQPAKGFTLLPDSQIPNHNGYELLLGYKFTGERLTIRHKVVMKYESAGIRYELVIPSQIVACPPAHDLEKCLRLARLD